MSFQSNRPLLLLWTDTSQNTSQKRSSVAASKILSVHEKHLKMPHVAPLCQGWEGKERRRNGKNPELMSAAWGRISRM